MAARRFDDRDAAALVANGRLCPGERLVWTCSRATVNCYVKGRKQNGKPKSTGLRVVARVLLFPVMVVLWILQGLIDEGWTGFESKDGANRTVTVTGRHTGCQAALLADARADGRCGC